MKILLRKTYYWKDRDPEVVISTYTNLKDLLVGWSEFKSERKSLVSSGSVTSITVRAINPVKAVPRPEKVQNGVWCPYCGCLSNFIPHDYDTGTVVCDECGISSNDYYVRKYNRRF